jgi:3-vinyl bacteriochlorophyllide hydratase
MSARAPVSNRRRAAARRPTGQFGLSDRLNNWIDAVAPAPWSASVGARRRKPAKPAPLYTPEQRARRDRSPWTIVQAVLAPLQFLIFAVSLVLVLRYLESGEGYALATGSIIAKTVALYAIMVTGSIWEKDVFGKWLFAPSFFWEDVFSMLVLGLQTLYLAALAFGWWTPQQQMLIAIAAYAAYVINAGQFLWKLRQARLESGASGAASNAEARA